jgi:S1-C subfamily serine protease
MRTNRITIGLLAALLVSFTAKARADQPKLGFSGTLIQLGQDYEPLHGYRVDSVRPRTPAAQIGLERGDIVVYISQTMAFTTRDAYLYALRQQGRTCKIGVINVRNGKLVWTTCQLNHNPQPHMYEPAPEGVIMVDFAHNMDHDL